MGLFSKKKKEKLALVFDVGSSQVSGALFKIIPNGNPKIVFSVVEKIPVRDKIKTEDFLNITNEALKVVASKICLKGLGAPKKVFCVLSSPWFASQTRTVHINKEEEFTFTPKIADEMINKEIKSFKKEYLQEHGGEKDQIRVIELKNMKTKLNGYKSSDPFGQKANQAELAIFFSVAEEKIIKLFSESINRHFHHEKINFTSFMMVSFAVARDIFINQESFILVNIGGEITDISMAKQDVLQESISFPLGENFMIRGLAQETKSSIHDAKVHLSMYKDGHVEKKALKNLEPAIEKIKNEWLKNFQEFLSKLTNDISIPSMVFITVEPKLVEFFADIIKNEQFNQYILTESKFRVVFLGGQALHGVVLFEENVLRDPSVILDCIYINHFLR